MKKKFESTHRIQQKLLDIRHSTIKKYFRMAIPVFRTVQDLRVWKKSVGSASVGFVATMGALHEGHISLVNESLDQTDHTIVSIFVNPSQFAPHEDLASYPRTFDADYAILASLPKQISGIFAPTVSEMYPSGIPLEVSQQQGAFVSVLGVSEQLEGRTRPNFFRGVATVVTKLFNAVQPTKAFFGQKDIQQTIVLKRMVKDLLIPTEIVVLPIVREDSGLALSSRNTYLSAGVRSKSALIYRALSKGEDVYKQSGSREEIVRAVESELSDELFKVDYISLADKETLTELDALTNGAILSIAVYVTEDGRTTRLIDNIIL